LSLAGKNYVSHNKSLCVILDEFNFLSIL